MLARNEVQEISILKDSTGVIHDRFIDSRQTILVNGYPYETRLDSGADVNLMKRSTAENLGLPFDNCYHQARGVSNQIITINEKTRVIVQLFDKKEILEFGVVDELPYPLMFLKPDT